MFRKSIASTERLLIAEIVACYGSTILDVIHLDAGSEPFSIGEAPEASFKLDGALLSDPAATTMVEVTDEGYALTTPAGFEAHLAGEADEWTLAAGERVELRPGLRAVLSSGPVRFYVRAVERERIVAARPQVDRPFWASIVGTGTLATAALLLMQSLPPDALAFAQDDELARANFARYLMQADAEEPVEPETARTSESGESEASPVEAKSSTPARANEPGGGRTGAPGKALPSSGPRSFPGISRNGDPIADATKAGILGMLAAQDRSFISDAAVGAFGDSEADALLWGSTEGLLGDGVVGSLGVTGGMHVGGTGDRVEGLGATGLLGDGVGSRDPGYDPAVRHSERTTRVPVTEFKDPKVTDNIDKDVIRRVVRAHVNEIRGCYNAGLTTNPNLSGRVTVKFTILAQGKVASSIIEGNTTRNSAVGDCIAKAVKRWKFPAVRGGGTAIVSYPFVLHTR